MGGMRRWNMILVLVAAIALTTQPLVHNHSLIPDGFDSGGSVSTSTLQCAFCATNNARTTVVVPQFATPLASSAEFVDLTAPTIVLELAGDIASRAPPAAV